MDIRRLNEEQEKVVRIDAHCLVIACPGAGKTTVLAHKAAKELERGRRVIAVTFTRSAADELGERITRMAPDADPANLLVGTFHRICLMMCFPGQQSTGFGQNILAQMRSPFRKNWTIAKKGVQDSYIIRAISESRAGIDLKSATSIIENMKASQSSAAADPRFVDMLAIYTSLMERHGYIDIQDIILKTNEALGNGSLTPLPVDCLLVDEFQDTDASQYEWISHHGRAGAIVTAVGDDDQSIYAFRRALGYDVMARFVGEFRAERITLGTNYRSRTEILDAAGRLISKNTRRVPKTLHAASGPGGTVSRESFDCSFKESVAITSEAEAAMTQNASFAVIARTHRELLAVESALLQRNIPFRKAEGESIFDCAEVQVFAAALRSLIKPVPADVDMVLGWAGVSEADTRAIRQIFGKSIRKGRLNDYRQADITEYGRRIWRKFADLHEEWTRMVEKGRHEIPVFSIHAWLGATIRKPHARYLVDVARNLYTPPQERSLKDHLAFRTRQEVQAKEDRSRVGEMASGVVHLLTCHGAKGLEYDRVSIIGLNQGSFPSEDASLEEERRLMYVAMTRARHRLRISAASQKLPSIFLYDSGLIRPVSEQRR